MSPDRQESIIPNSGGNEGFEGNTIRVPEKNWIKLLPEAIRQASSGDRIIVVTEAMKELGERALSRMRPDENISFIVEEQNS